MTASRIVLVRHGPSAHIQHARFVNRGGVEQWRDAYDAAGIEADCQPPRALIDIARGAAEIFASDLPRAVESAGRLAETQPVRTSELLREIPLAIPRWPTRLPLTAWGTIIHFGWLYQIVRGTDASARDRARAAKAVELIAGGATEHSTVLVVTHGVFRRLLAAELVARGWTTKGRPGGYRHWSAWTFDRRGTTAGEDAGTR
jgi:broad specificity phosphatase PhoE